MDNHSKVGPLQPLPGCAVTLPLPGLCLSDSQMAAARSRQSSAPAALALLLGLLLGPAPAAAQLAAASLPTAAALPAESVAEGVVLARSDDSALRLNAFCGLVLAEEGAAVCTASTALGELVRRASCLRLCKPARPAYAAAAAADLSAVV